MKHLERILISNVRRFRENVEISLGRGATVFLAPNGTGKTAIFEAIELALTGSVRRLPFPPTALIRDTKEKSFIRLDFESGKYCEADFEKGKEPKLSGNHSDLFGTIPMTDVPYLLRLTHLLNQRNQEWLVQNSSDEAGNQLNHLSIGREASHANNLMASAKRASKTLIEGQERKVEEVQIQLAKWTELIQSRKVSQSNFRETLVPLALIYQRIVALCKPWNVVPPTTQDVATFIETVNIVKDIVNRSLEDTRKRLLTIETLGPLAGDFASINVALQGAVDSVSKNKEAKVKLATQIAELQDKFSLTSKTLQEGENELIRLQGIKASKEQLDQLVLQIENSKVSLDSNVIERDKMTLEMKTIETALAEAERILGLQSTISALEGEMIRNEASINEKTRLIEMWQEKIAGLEKSKKELEEVTSKEARIKIDVETARINHSNQQVVLEKAQKAFDSLNATTDTIKGAIGIIASKIPDDTNECPVCLHHYDDGELQKKIAQALNNINPLLSDATKSLEIETAKQQELASHSFSCISNLKKTETDRLKIEVDIKTLEGEITNKIINQLGTSALDEANVKLEKEKQNFTKLKIQLEERRTQLQGQPSVLIQPLQDRLSKIKNNLSELQQSIVRTEVEINNKSQQLTSLQDRLNLSRDVISDVYLALISQEKNITDIKKAIDLIRKEQENLQRILSQTNDILVSEEQNYNKLTGRVAEIRSKWRAEQFVGDPNSEALKVAKQEQTDIEITTQRSMNEVGELQENLQRWKASEVLRIVEKEINDLRENLSEAEYEKTLNQKVIQVQSELSIARERNLILHQLAKNLTAQLDNVNKQIDSINPLWSALLKRIVLEPRFAGTTLNSYTHYKKQRADVNVTLHNEQYSASQIASEAQITDLQFTFLLSMARQYSWSPWKALLLDDPTQHHDLVHASAVFDLLRDYVVEQDFQVLLATHDSVQANFLVRKLENDGISTRL
ncbi:MAG: hypothetical protein C0490_04690, partial [Marivirga sp.]|nr:hypothetical protein [Marivirga sp.]